VCQWTWTGGDIHTSIVSLSIPAPSSANAIPLLNNDLIYGGDNDDVIIGQYGNDVIFGNDGEDDIIGGHNTYGMLDGDDQLYGGDQNDVIIGDNGAISRDSSIVGSVNQCLPYPLSFMWSKYTSSLDPNTFGSIRDVLLFDVGDGIGGDDTIDGGAHDDRLFGERGNDILIG
jgi:Ca2+-binding RTX toxin-like protein